MNYWKKIGYQFSDDIYNWVRENNTFSNISEQFVHQISLNNLIYCCCVYMLFISVVFFLMYSHLKKSMKKNGKYSSWCDICLTNSRLRILQYGAASLFPTNWKPVTAHVHSCIAKKLKIRGRNRMFVCTCGTCKMELISFVTIYTSL